MHYVLVWWIKERIQPLLKGYIWLHNGFPLYSSDCFRWQYISWRMDRCKKDRNCIGDSWVHVRNCTCNVLSGILSDIHFDMTDSLG